MSKTRSSSSPTKNSCVTTAQASFLSEFLPNRLKALEVLQTRQQRREAVEQASGLVQAATRDAYTWATGYTKTKNEHWVEEGRPTPYEPFPRLPHFPPLFQAFESERIVWIEKSRDMMVSWACVAYLTFYAMKIPECGVLFQCQKEDKVKKLVDYAKTLYRMQDQRLQDAFPLTKPIDDQPALALNFARGGYVQGIPGGADQIRSAHPWGYLNDESSFQPDAGECFNEALSAVAGKIIFNSSAGPGWYADARHDIIRNVED
jgi:hypothetical protein